MGREVRERDRERERERGRHALASTHHYSRREGWGARCGDMPQPRGEKGGERGVGTRVAAAAGYRYMSVTRQLYGT